MKSFNQSHSNKLRLAHPEHLFDKTSVFFLYKGATLVNKKADGFYTLAGSPAWELVLNPLVAYTSTTVYVCRERYIKNESNVESIKVNGRMIKIIFRTLTIIMLGMK